MATLTKREAADILGVSPSAVQRMMDRGELRPAATITAPSGVVIMHTFRRSDVDRLAKRRAA